MTLEEMPDLRKESEHDYLSLVMKGHGKKHAWTDIMEYTSVLFCVSLVPARPRVSLSPILLYLYIVQPAARAEMAGQSFFEEMLLSGRGAVWSFVKATLARHRLNHSEAIMVPSHQGVFVGTVTPVHGGIAGLCPFCPSSANVAASSGLPLLGLGLGLRLGYCCGLPNVSIFRILEYS